jgi:DNA-binding beta-propeller fold protein YncE
VKTSSALLIVIVSTVTTSALAAGGGYHLLQKVSVPGDDGWDHPAVDTAGRRLYVSHGSHVVVMDVDSGKLAGKIDKTPGVHAIAIDPELRRGFITNGDANSITIFNLKTLETIGEVKVTGETPGPIVYDPFTKRVFAFNLRSNSATAIDAKEGKVAGTIDIGGRPQAPATDAKGHVFVNLVDKDVVLQIDSRKLTAGERWPLGTCQRPGTMAIDHKNGRLFVGCGNRLMAILDANDGRLITTVPIGEGRDEAAFDPKTRLVFSSNSEGTVTVIRQESADKYSVLETVKTEPGAKNMALDLKTHKLFLPLSDRGPALPVTGGNPSPPGKLIPGTFRILIYGM